MLTTYIFPLLAVVALCAFWAIFKTRRLKIVPDAKRR
jgi:hypothetical protein